MKGWKRKRGARLPELAKVAEQIRGWTRFLRSRFGRSKVLQALLWVTLLMAAIVVIPTILVSKGTSNAFTSQSVQLPELTLHTSAASASDAAVQERPISFPIYLTAEKRVTSVTLEQYVRGVVAAEMPIEFELEALKAQAIAARTYIVRRFVTSDVSNVPVEGAWVTDSVQHQAYLTDQELVAKWDKDVRSTNLDKLTRAVEETWGQIMTYEGEPILAAFFSTSNGYTENSEDYWSEKLPYLRSVKSPWEADISPKFTSTAVLTTKEFARLLGVSVSKAARVTILETSAGNRVKQVTIGGKTFTGREVREKLKLASTEFAISAKEGNIHIAVRGNGHGVGMSQWGAQGMALAGYSASSILSHYYSGITIEKFRQTETIL